MLVNRDSLTTSVNCNIFGDSQLNGKGGSRIVPGICSGIQSFFGIRALANSDMVLTWDPEIKRTTVRRLATCGPSYCSTEEETLQRLTADSSIRISCDEFPFAGTEEGGNFLRTLNQNPGEAQTTCVPAWQNTLQGNCNSKLVPGSERFRRDPLTDLNHRATQRHPNECCILRKIDPRRQCRELRRMDHQRHNRPVADYWKLLQGHPTAETCIVSQPDPKSSRYF